MMMLIYLIAITILLFLLVGTILIALNYFGLFDKIQISVGQLPVTYGQRKVVFRIASGRYYDSSQIFTEICSILPKWETFGIYLHRDHWNNTLKEQIDVLKIVKQETNFTSSSSPDQKSDFVFVVGALFPQDANQDDPQSTNSVLKKESEDLLKEKGYQFGFLPEQVDYVVYTRFPYRGILSVVVASRRIYAAIEKYLQETKLIAYPTIEIYRNDDIHYIVPLSRHDYFLKFFTESISNQQKQDQESIIKESENDEEQPQDELSAGSSDSSYEMVDEEES